MDECGDGGAAEEEEEEEENRVCRVARRGIAQEMHREGGRRKKPRWQAGECSRRRAFRTPSHPSQLSGNAEKVGEKKKAQHTPCAFTCAPAARMHPSLRGKTGE